MTKRNLQPQKAKAEKLRPNILVYGESGAGKTLLGLQLAKLTGAKLLVIDGDGGTRDYGGIFDFHHIVTDDPLELEAQVDYYLEHPGEFTMMMVDPISVFHQRVEAMADDEIRPHKGKVGRFSSVLDPGARANIKRLNRITLAKLRRLDMALVVTARAKPKYKVVTHGGKLKGLEREGTTWEGDNMTDYEFRDTLQLVKFGDRRVVQWEKTRGKANSRIEADDPLKVAEKLLPVITNPQGFTDAAEARPVVTEEMAEEIHDLVRSVELEPGELTRILGRAGASEVEELPRDAGEKLITWLKAKKD